MKNIEKILLALLFIGFIAKNLEIVGGNIIIFTSSLFLIGVYLFGGFYFLRDPKQGGNNVILSILLGIFYALEISYLMLVVLHWIKTNIFILLAIAVFNLAVLMSFFLMNRSGSEYYKRNNIIRLAIVLLMLELFGYLSI